jgi:hypothetical protein
MMGNVTLWISGASDLILQIGDCRFRDSCRPARVKPFENVTLQVAVET